MLGWLVTLDTKFADLKTTLESGVSCLLPCATI